LKWQLQLTYISRQRATPTCKQESANIKTCCAYRQNEMTLYNGVTDQVETTKLLVLNVVSKVKKYIHNAEYMDDKPPTHARVQEKEAIV
jgi:hypothetical protein